MTYNDETVQALARLRQYAKAHTVSAVGTVPNAMASLVNTLDNAGVFAALDEQTDYATAEDILAEAAGKALDKELGALDPAEWGDTTRLDQARRQGRCTCGQAAESHVSLHAGTCPVWAQHHSLI